MVSPSSAQRVQPETQVVAMRLLRDFAIHTKLSIDVQGVASHPEDDPVLATAVSAAADYLVTGDRQLQQLGSYQGVRIVSPREFLTLLDRLERDDEQEP